MKAAAILIAISFFIASCSSSKDEGSTTARTTGTGTTTNNGPHAIRGRVIIKAECGATTATVWVGPVGLSSVLNQASVPNSGTFDFILSAGSYELAAQAGYCFVRGVLQTLTSPTALNIVCLGNTCSQGKPGEPSLMQGKASGLAPATPCSFSQYGCSGGERAVRFVSNSVHLRSDEKLGINLGLEVASDSRILSASPALADQSWKILVGPSSQLSVDGTNYPALSYSVETDSTKIQYEQGFCNERSATLDSMADYLTLSQFSEAAVAKFRSDMDKSLPEWDRLCVFPQEASTANSIVALRSTASVDVRRVWFVVVPDYTSAQIKKLKLSPTVVARLSKPKQDALKTLKANSRAVRAIASAESGSLTVEEWGVGYINEK
ncbi:MAG: hypothetical protein N2578_06245 [Bdellovibrionaceae bacterium]|nr:hypothetical protein [Pseudobdellovibrionaceae bacterium]